MAVQISGNDITVPRDGSFTRNVTIGGTLTYEDVTNIDSVGLITARTGIEIGARPGVAASISVDGNMIVSGVTTLGGEVQIPDFIHHVGDNNCKFGFESGDTFAIETAGSERVRVTSGGNLGIGTITPSGLLHTHAASGTNRNYIEASAGNSFLRLKSGSTSHNSGVEFFSGSSNSANITGLGGGGLNFEVGGSERVRITSGGQVLIANTADPSDYNSGADDLIIGSHSSASGATILSPTNNSGFIMFSDNNGGGTNAYRGQIEYYHGDDYMRFMTASSERIRFGSSGQIGIAGANYGTSGQVLTSQGSGSAVQWATPASGWVHAAEVTLPTNASSYTFTGIPDGASHIRYLIRYMSFAGTAQSKVQLQKSTTGGSKSIISSNYISFSTYVYAGGANGGSNTDGVDLFDAYSNPANSFFGIFEIFRIGTNGSDGTNYYMQHFGVNHGGSNPESTFQSSSYIELGSSSTDFISGAKFYSNTGENFDNGYINQSYLLS